ncbi:hypothetical protein [Dyadobacter koreensis]|nr:hypothetical protein [Dyadobacter koreensis]
METYLKLIRLEEYLAEEVRWIQYNLDLQQVRDEEYNKLPGKLQVCEQLHIQVRRMAVAF